MDMKTVGTGEEYYQQYLSGDERGFDLVIDLYREPLIFFLLRYLPCMEDAEDAAEDAFVSLLLHPYRPGGKASLKTYLFTLGRNRALSLLKAQKRRERREWAETAVREDADYPALEERVCQNETRRELLQSLDAIAPDYREALYLLYFEGLSLDEAARVMKKSKKQVENLSYRGKQALKGQLGKENTHENR